jgi:hypothetical protein
MAIRDKADQRLADKLVLADDNALDLALDAGGKFGELLDGYLVGARGLALTASTSAAPTG